VLAIVENPEEVYDGKVPPEITFQSIPPNTLNAPPVVPVIVGVMVPSYEHTAALGYAIVAVGNVFTVNEKVLLVIAEQVPLL
jgi:hypothetical protein